MAIGSPQRQQFESEARKGAPNWTVVVDSLNSLNMPEMLQSLNALTPTQRKQVLAKASEILGDQRSWNGAVERIKFAADVVTTRKIPAAPAGLPEDQVNDARNFLKLEPIEIRSITKEIFGTSDANNLCPARIPSIPVIVNSTFKAGDQSNVPKILPTVSRAGRIGAFACKKGSQTRAVVVLLPESGVATTTLVGVTHGFSQGGRNVPFWKKLGWEDPLSKPMIEFVANNFVRIDWGAQMLAASQKMAMVLIVRAAGSQELGPFSGNGAFLKESIQHISKLVGGALTANSVEFFTFSSGIGDLNPLLASAANQMPVKAVYNLDPASGISAAHIKGASLKQFTSGQTFKGHTPAGFELMSLKRWANDPDFKNHDWSNPKIVHRDQFDYLHNHTLRNYCLHLGISLVHP